MTATQYIGDGRSEGVVIGQTTTELVGFFGATPVNKAAATEDLKDLLVAYGLVTDSGASDLNLDGGDITCDAITATSLSVSGLASFASDISITASGDLTVDTVTATSLAISGLTSFSSDVDIIAANLETDTTTGMKIGTATDQKVGFFNATAVVQPVSASQAAVAVTAGTTSGSSFLASVQSLATANKTLVNQLRSDLVTLGLLKGSA